MASNGYKQFMSPNFRPKATSNRYKAGDTFDESGAFETVRFGPTDDGFVIGTFLTEEGEKIVCKGTVPGFILGAPYHITGKVIDDKNWGIQVNVKHAVGSKPTTEGQIEAFLASGVVPGIGPVTAKKIVQHFGKETLHVLEDEPERLEEVSGIGRKSIRKMIDTLPQKLKYREVIGFFSSLGISVRTIDRLIAEYGQGAKEIVEKNPYILCRVRGFAFTRADSIARKMGVAIDNPNRLYAGVMATLRYLCDSEGHTVVPEDMLVAKAQEKLLLNDITKISRAIEELLMNERIIRDEDGFHLKHLYEAERAIKKRLAGSVGADVILREDKVNELLSQVEAEKGFTLTDEQAQGVRNAFSRQISILSGEAGAGKAQPLYSRVLTEYGWRPMGEISVGDKIWTPSGRLAEVSGVFPQGEKRVWRVIAENGRCTDCCDEHIWRIVVDNDDDRENRKDSDRYRTKDMTLREILDARKRGELETVRIPNVMPMTPEQPGGAPIASAGTVEIIDIKDMGVSTEMQCIMVDDPDHLYITDDYIVTHNTAVSSAIVSIARKAGIDVCLMSPTGRAAKHLSDTCGGLEPGYTMHRALSIQIREARDDDFFDDDESKSVLTKNMSEAVNHFRKAQLVIADEASMMDTEMAAILIQACKNKHLMLVGDPNQLPSVGPGRVLGDLMESSYSQTGGMLTFLTKVFRQKAGSPVIAAANAVREGHSPAHTPGVRFYECTSNEQVPEMIEKHVLPYLRERQLGYENYAFLSPIKKTPSAGVDALNAFLRPKLNPYYKKPANENQEFLFQRGDFVMQTKNNYDIDIYNGDIGIVTAVDSNGDLEVLFSGDEEEVCYEKDEVYGEHQIIPAFAMTVHKSQGDQYDTVAVILTSSQFPMLNRNMLYTAITRAERELILIGDAKAFAMAARNQKENNRLTGLRGL